MTELDTTHTEAAAALHPVTVTVNGQGTSGDVEARGCSSLPPRGPGFTGTHVGCDTTMRRLHGPGRRDAVEVLHDAGRRRRRRVTTVEGLARGGQLHPIQEAFTRSTACSVASARRG